MRTPLLAAIITTAILAGCNSNTRTYDIIVQNNTEQPVTLWLTKDGPPPERGWYTPEQFMANSNPNEPSPGVMLPPGRQADTGNVSGQFPKGTNAILNIFRDDTANHHAGKPVIVQLHPGKNALKLKTIDDGRLTVQDQSSGATIATEP